jgi:uncharacterized membrane protein
MQWWLILAVAIHVMAAVFWAGSTFTVARLGGVGADQMIRPQIGSALVVVLSGGYLWHVFHDGQFGAPEKVLAGAALSAVIALIIQLVAMVRSSRGVDQHLLLAGNRLAAPLLVLTVLGMAAVRFV